MKIEFAKAGSGHFVRLEGRTVLELDERHGTYHWQGGPESQWKEYQAEGGPRAEARERWYYRLATALDAVHTLTGGCQCPELETVWTLYGSDGGKRSGGAELPLHIQSLCGWTSVEVQTADWIGPS